MKQDDFIEIKNPKTLCVNRLPSKRIYLGHLYKPSIARLSNDKLLIVAEDCRPNRNMHEDNDHPIFQSEDGGHTWLKLVVPDLTGGEPYLTVLKDGTLLMTGDTFIRSSGDTSEKFSRSYLIHRSEDGGRSWFNPETTDVQYKTLNSRVLELSDGSLMFIKGIYGDCGNFNPNDYKGRDGRCFLWRSFDSGRTWKEECQIHVEKIPKVCGYPFFCEASLYQSYSSNKIYAVARVTSTAFPLEDTPIPLMLPNYKKDFDYLSMREKYPPELPLYSGYDGHVPLDDIDRAILYSSTDLGRTWKKIRNIGTYGEVHYTSILRLHDGRLLWTFTVRALAPQLGIQAVLGRETEDDICFDFEHDRIIIEAKTPPNQVSGGGFGPTVQLSDGTLVTSYSYRTGKDNMNDLHSEVVCWRLP